MLVLILFKFRFTVLSAVDSPGVIESTSKEPQPSSFEMELSPASEPGRVISFLKNEGREADRFIEDKIREIQDSFEGKIIDFFIDKLRKNLRMLRKHGLKAPSYGCGTLGHFKVKLCIRDLKEISLKQLVDHLKSLEKMRQRNTGFGKCRVCISTLNPCSETPVSCDNMSINQALDVSNAIEGFIQGDPEFLVFHEKEAFFRQLDTMIAEVLDNPTMIALIKRGKSIFLDEKGLRVLNRFPLVGDLVRGDSREALEQLVKLVAE